MFRDRICNNPSPIGGGLNCSGDPRKFAACSSNVCPGKISMPSMLFIKTELILCTKPCRKTPTSLTNFKAKKQRLYWFIYDSFIGRNEPLDSENTLVLFNYKRTFTP